VLLPSGPAAAAACGEVGREVQLSCGEHTDYGLLTLVRGVDAALVRPSQSASPQWFLMGLEPNTTMSAP
jgi:isopenicillin N synthase-like dioxygenase